MKFSIRPAAVAFLCAAATSITGCVPPSPANGSMPPTPGATLTGSLYVADSGTNDVTVVDSAGKIITTIPVGKSPSGIAFDAATGYTPKHAFVANRASNTVTVINVADNTIAATIPVGAAPSAVTYGEGGIGNANIFVANSGDGTVSQIDPSTLKVTATYPVGANPTAIASESGNGFGVLSTGANDVQVVQTTNQKTLATLRPFGTAVGVASVNGSYTVATSDGVLHPFASDTSGNWTESSDIRTGATAQYAKQMYINDWALINTQAGTLTVYDTFYGKIEQTLNVGASPVDMAFHVGGNGNNPPLYIYVANKSSDSVSWYQGTDISKPFTAQPVITLAKGAQPVAVATYDYWQLPSPSPSPSATPAATSTPAATATPAPTATPGSAGSRLYVGNYGAGSVTVYAPPFGNASSPALSFADTSLAGGPLGVAVSGTYVATSHLSGSVNVYAQPVSAASVPVATFGAAASGYMAFDPQGNLWAGTQGTCVAEYPAPFTNATAERLLPGATDTMGVAFDAAGNMYVTNGDATGHLIVYAPPYTAVTNTYTVAGASVALRADAVRGSQLFVADARDNLIDVFTLPLTSGTPAFTFSASAPMGIAFDGSGNLYVSSQTSSQIQIFDPPFSGSSVPVSTITSGLNQAYGLGFGP